MTAGRLADRMEVTESVRDSRGRVVFIVRDFGRFPFRDLAANKLTNFRISELEKKVEKHNNVIERVTILEQSEQTQWRRLDEIRATIEKIKEEVYKHEQ